MKDTFKGSALIVWFADGKQKYKFCDTQELFVKEFKRIQEIVPPKNIVCTIIDWGEQTVETWAEEKTLHDN